MKRELHVTPCCHWPSRGIPGVAASAVLPRSVVLRYAEIVLRWLTAPNPAKHEQRVRRVCAAAVRC